jgi:hypothetical protein
MSVCEGSTVALQQKPIELATLVAAAPAPAAADVADDAPAGVAAGIGRPEHLMMGLAESRLVSALALNDVSPPPSPPAGEVRSRLARGDPFTGADEKVVATTKSATARRAAEEVEVATMFVVVVDGLLDCVKLIQKKEKE